jgi:aspartyl-tRNA(Asn)/glutamyl-tRNA(Gln) amidotransferase subunit C
MNKEDLNKLAKLCRISCTPEEEEKFVENITQILSYVEALKKIDTQGVPCCNMVLETFSNVMREDIPGELLSRENFLANAPAHIGGMVKVPPVLKQG